MKPLIPVAASLLVLAGLANSAGEPSVKEGLWSIHTETVSQPGNKKVEGTRSLCRSHAYDDDVRARAKAVAANCKTIVDKSEGGKSESETECVIAGTTAHGKSTSTITGDSAVHSETHTTYNPALGGMTEMTMVIDQKYVGACPAGVEPGDSIAPDGTVRKAPKR
jgi:Protein of unknown function (DUF3617)